MALTVALYLIPRNFTPKNPILIFVGSLFYRFICAKFIWKRDHISRGITLRIYVMNFSTLNLSSIVCLTGLFLASCADDSTGGSRPSGTDHLRQASGEDRERGDTPPRMGMTKDQVLQLYGEPMNITTSRHGETWSYAFNDFDPQSLIPVYGGWHQVFKKRHSGSVTFNGSGRVIDYQWSQSNLRAGTIYH